MLAEEPRGARIAMTYGAPLDLGRHDRPRTPAQVHVAPDRTTRAVVATVCDAERTTGPRLPGPLRPGPTTSEESTTHD